MKFRICGSRKAAVLVAAWSIAALLVTDPAVPSTPAASALPPSSASASEFDSSQPFALVSYDGPGEPHIDTLDGAPPSRSEVAAVGEALDFRIVEPPAHMAYATAGSNYFWRGEPDDLDVHLRTLSYIPDEAVLIIKEVFADFQDTIDMDLPDELWHEIDVSWDTDLPAGVLAGASTTWVTVSQGGSTFRLPLALYESLGGTGATNNAPSMSITINANADWDMALQPANTTITNFYLKTVLLHEVGHGLGFASGISSPEAADSSFPTPWSTRIYRQQDLAWSLNAHGSEILESNDLWFENADGTWERIFDPSTWQAGSSLSHLNESTYPYVAGSLESPGALMTPYLQRGEISQIDGIVVGMLARLGYNTFLGPLAPTISLAQDDDTITISIDPVEGGAANVPAETWTVRLVDDSDIVVAQQTVLATVRDVAFAGLQADTAHTAIVIGTTDGNSNEVSIRFTTEPAPLMTTTTAAQTTTEATATTTTTTTTTSTTATSATTVEPRAVSPASACLLEGNADQFALSSEQAASVYRLYCSYFLRLPDTNGFAYWLRQNESGTSLRRISDFFADSNEFRERYGSLTAREYVTLTYANVLERLPDEGGYNYWVSRLDSGLLRGDLTLYFSDSAEFRERTHTG